MSRRVIRSVIPSLVLVAAAIAAIACGPFFPNRLLVGGDSAVLWAPVADFRVEVGRLLPEGKPEFAAAVSDSEAAIETSLADQADLAAALQRLALSDAERKRIIAGHREARLSLSGNAMVVWRRKYEISSEVGSLKLMDVPIPTGLPAEFAEYMRGADAHYRGDLAAARRHWEAVLALPDAERRYRSTWAAFMLGKSWLDDGPESAVPYFERVRTLTRAGFRDSLGLASSSLGWQAQAELKGGRFEQAVNLYFEHMLSGDPTAVMSLRTVAGRILQQPDETLRRVAGHEAARNLVTAFVLSQGGPRTASDAELPDSGATRWLRAVEVTGARSVAAADRMAWLAYQCGAFAQAERWLGLAPGDSGITHWIRAKMLLRAGKIETAAIELAAAIRAFPADEEWVDVCMDYPEDAPYGYDVSPARRVRGELGVLKLSRRQYVDALDLLLRADYWMDAAYVAERVLSIEELITYVTKSWPAPTEALEAEVLGAWRDAEFESDGSQDQALRAAAELRRQARRAIDIRHLLARRLARAGRFADARPLLPRGLQPVLDKYTTTLRDGKLKTLPAAERSHRLWEAAQLCRNSGLDLLATELEPDWYALGGQFELSPVSKVRNEASTTGSAASSADERARAARSALPGGKRWHYRYVAADLAWRAIELMPDESDETAEALWEAGSWIKARDPQAADRFYKALVRRCGSTELGKEARRLRWFPSGDGTPPR